VKEFVGVAVNPMLVESGDKFTGSAEVILVYSEPHFRPNLGSMDRIRESGEYRVALSASGLRQLSGHLIEYAELLEAMETRANGAAVTP
jgi:hypothetical protein